MEILAGNEFPLSAWFSTLSKDTCIGKLYLDQETDKYLMTHPKSKKKEQPHLHILVFYSQIENQ